MEQIEIKFLICKFVVVYLYAQQQNWKMVACGRYHTLAIKTNRTLWVWEYNYSDQLGLGDTTDRYQQYYFIDMMIPKLKIY